jgi:histidinol-phosphate/aromatic aminotransferase/cobyric acid decarboxylase-like protein
MTDDNPIRPQPGILDIALYKGGDSKIAGIDAPLKLSSNENPFGPSEAAKEAAELVLEEDIAAELDAVALPMKEYFGRNADMWENDANCRIR